MIAGIMLLCAVVILLQFFVSCCRSLIAASVRQPLSAELTDVTGLLNSASGGDFARVVQLLCLCPGRPEDRGEIRAIGAYFRLLTLIKGALAPLTPWARAWIEAEQAHCTYFATVALDRRIAFSRSLLAQQSDA